LHHLNELIPEMPVLETKQLVIRPFQAEDLDDLITILDVQLENHWPATQRERYIQWSELNVAMHVELHQPPFGDRAITLKSDGTLIGACGLAPTLAPMGLLTSCEALGETPETALTTIETGLYYALSFRQQGKGYASEAAKALVDFSFETLRLARIIATTDYDNTPSQRVMQRVGMRLEKNRFEQPFWWQVVGILENPYR